MPWTKDKTPPAMKNLPKSEKAKAAKIAEGMRKKGVDEGIAIATGIARAKGKKSKHDK